MDSGLEAPRDVLRVLTFNLLTMQSAEGRRRHQVARAAMAELAADVVALQEVTRGAEFDQAADLLGPGYTIIDLPGRHPEYGGECLASRWPVHEVVTLDRPLAEDAGSGARATAVAFEISVPSFGRVLAVHHKGTYQLQLEGVREQQAVATARFVEDLVAERADLPVVLMGDFNAGPEAASLQFLTGRRSLGGLSVRYEDAWEAAHPHDPGHTFSPRNSLVRAGQMPLERGRRIDHVLVRSGAHGPLLDTVGCQLVLDDPVDGVWASDHFGVLAELRHPDHAPGAWKRPQEATFTASPRRIH
jgi:endonuclease/exonuclease/phosphatase family metal-dependent hydrolase